MRRALPLLLAGVIGMVVAAACGSTATPSAGGSTSTTPTTASAPPASTPGSTTTAAGPGATLDSAVAAAFGQEQTAATTYANVTTRLGNVGPFPNVAAAEAQHATAVQHLAADHRIALPSGPFTGQASPATLADACRLGISVEQATVALYDRLLAQVGSYPDATQVFTTLRSAAADSHLPAFQRCA